MNKNQIHKYSKIPLQRTPNKRTTLQNGRILFALALIVILQTCPNKRDSLDNGQNLHCIQESVVDGDFTVVESLYNKSLFTLAMLPVVAGVPFIWTCVQYNTQP